MNKPLNLITLKIMKSIVALLTLLICSQAGAKEIALTFDDSPRFARGHLDGPTRSQFLIENLKKANVQAVAFFSVSSHLDDEGRARLEAYSRAGHIIANHTHTHPDFNSTTVPDYVQEFKTAHSQLSGFLNFEKWFRFPYLREGDSLEKRDAMRSALQEMGYINAYVTINNYDWYMEEQFQKAIRSNPSLDQQKFKSFYVSTLLKAVDYYDQMAVRHLGRSPKHVLLLHETDTNALFIADLVIALRSSGWKIISPRQAYQDPILNYQTSRILPRNPGRVGEIARDKGQTDGLWHETCGEAYLDRAFKEQVLGAPTKL